MNIDRRQRQFQHWDWYSHRYYVQVRVTAVASKLSPWLTPLTFGNGLSATDSVLAGMAEPESSSSEVGLLYRSKYARLAEGVIPLFKIECKRLAVSASRNLNCSVSYEQKHMTLYLSESVNIPRIPSNTDITERNRPVLALRSHSCCNRKV